MTLGDGSAGNFKSGESGSGKTSRYYRFSPATDDFAITIPAGAEWYAVRGNANAIAIEVHTAARGSVETRDSRLDLAAAASEQLRPCKPGEFINISHDDGATAIGEFFVVLEGNNLPDGASNVTTADPGP